MAKRKTKRATAPKRVAKSRATKTKRRKATSKKKAPQKPKKPSPWHICDDCIDPLAEGIRDFIRDSRRSFQVSTRVTLVKEYDELWSEQLSGVRKNGKQREARMSELKKQLKALPPPPVGPHSLRSLYREHNAEFAVTWLKICVSVDFAKDFESKLFQPLHKLLNLDHRACRLLNGQDVDDADKDGETTWRHYAIPQAIEMEYEELRRNERDYPPADGFIERQSDLELEFTDTVTYLRQVSHILRAKMQGKGVTDDIPVREHAKAESEWTREHSPAHWRRVFAVDGQPISQDTLNRRIRDGQITKHPRGTTKAFAIKKDEQPPGYVDN